MAGLEPLADKLADLLVADFPGFDFFPDFDRRLGTVAGAEGGVELFERRRREIDQLDLHRGVIAHGRGRALQFRSRRLNLARSATDCIARACLLLTRGDIRLRGAGAASTVLSR